MKEHNKRWLISRMKTSGSKRRYLVNGRFSDERNTKKYQDFENLPNHENIRTTWKLYNGKLNYGLLVRFLRGQVGKSWDDVYSEVVSRIPTKLLDHKEIVFWFVADKIEIIDNKPFNKKTNKFIWTPDQGDYQLGFDTSEFYVDPLTNKLFKVEDRATKRKTKGLDESSLREFKELEKSQKLNDKKSKQILKEQQVKLSQELLNEHNKQKQGGH